MKFVLMLVCLLGATNTCDGTTSTTENNPTTAPTTESPTTLPPTESPTLLTLLTQTDNPSTTQTDNPSTTTTNNPSTTQTDNPSTTQTTDNPSTTQTDNPSTTQTDNPSTTQTDNPSTTQTDNPSTTTTNNPSTTQNPSTDPPTTTYWHDPSTTETTQNTTENTATYNPPTTPYPDDDDHHNCTNCTSDPCNCTEPTPDPAPPAVPQVTCDYYRSTRTLTCTVGGVTVTITGVIIPPGELEDSEVGGPTPLGEYLIEEIHTHATKNRDWIRLHPKLECGKYWHYGFKNPDTGRCGIALHPGTGSEGCVVIPQSSWDILKVLLQQAESVDRKVDIPDCKKSTRKIIGTLTVHE